MDVFEVIGYAAVGLLALKLVTGFYSTFMVGGVKPTAYGKWAVITGATDGIGKALAFELARKGMNILLISRTQSKLDAVANEISEKFPDAETKTLSVDYSNFNEQKQGEVKAELENLGDDLGILVNNVGMSYMFPLYFHELSDEDCNALLNLNVHSTTMMTRLALPVFLAKESKTKGSIVNIGSFAGLFPSPLLAEYSAAKSYVEKLSYSLNVEYKDQGISVQCHSPLYIVSKMSKFKKSTLMIPSAEAYARSVISHLGGAAIVSGHWLQSILTFGVLSYIPNFLFLPHVKNMHLAIRKKGFRKLEREKEAKKTQ